MVWARDRGEARAAIEPVKLMYGGSFDEQGLSGLVLTDGLAARIHVHVLPLANLSARFLAYQLWEPIEREEFVSDADAAALLVVLDARGKQFDANVEQLKRLRDACGTHSAMMAVLFNHDDVEASQLLTAEERDRLLDFGGLVDATVYESADLGSVAAFDAFFHAIADEGGLGEHFRVVASER